MIYAFDLRGTICNGRDPIRASMASKIKYLDGPYAIITGQDIADHQVINVAASLDERCHFYTNDGALCWDKGSEEFNSSARFTKEEIDKLMNIINKAPINIPLYEPPKVWSDVQISLWCINKSLEERWQLAHQLNAIVGDEFRVGASGINTIAIYKKHVNKARALDNLTARYPGQKIVYIGNEFAFGSDKCVADLPWVECVSCDPDRLQDFLPINVKYIGEGPWAVEKWLDEQRKPIFLYEAPTENTIEKVFLLRVENDIIDVDFANFISKYDRKEIVLATMPKRADSKSTHVMNKLLTRIGSPMGFRVISEHSFYENMPRRSMVDFPTIEGRDDILRRANAFYTGVSLSGKTILLFDDVIISGTSLKVAASVLLKAGAENVIPIGFIQAPIDDLMWEKKQEERIRKKYVINPNSSV